ncbi:MAG: EAL domain-containing protein [Gammaproteobacteria bacterium]|nr:EAL domain-containing protein [Gammaproteobacteria bacterium]MBU2058303.1 EAL domain-containing protein [Gammaproteobacteria bacterium]MBU2176644.1 EAL domain-containing protein [Gammaproteobacteria bacterium]MBU2248414.1 EAL domain-containing protein [Gammaproteobacteria bacterium]MBU2345723.1 EAL domain-containing protein [Gammaproteobacteria bacterium]
MRPFVFSLPWKILLATISALLCMTVLQTSLGLMRMSEEFDRQQQVKRESARQQYLQQNTMIEQQLRVWLESFSDLVQLSQHPDFSAFIQHLAEQSANMQLHLNIEQIWLHNSEMKLLFSSGQQTPYFSPALVQDVLKKQSPSTINLCIQFCVKQLSLPVLNSSGEVAVMTVTTTLVDILSALHQSLNSDVALIRASRTATGKVNRGLISSSNPQLVNALLQKVSDPEADLALSEGLELHHNGQQYLISAFEMQSKGVYLTVVDNISDFVATNNGYRRQLLITSAFLFGGMVLLVYLIMRRISLRLKKLSQALPLLSQKQYAGFRQQSQCDASTWPDEVDLLRQAADELSVELEQLNHKVEQHTSELEKVAMYDLLTTLPNRNMLQYQLDRMLSSQVADQKFLAVLFVDLDDFKRINDSLGHAQGDKLLKLVALRLKDCCGVKDLLCRFGGDEFVFVLPQLADVDAPFRLASQILQRIQQPLTIDQQNFVMTASLGLTMSMATPTDADDLIRQADLAMHEVKLNGGNGAQAYNLDMYQRVQQRVLLEQDLKEALLLNQFSISFQPQMIIATGALYGFEALIRWRHPIRGMVPPDEFIPVLEQSRQIVPLGYWIIEQCMQQCLSLLHSGWHHFRIAINLSAEQFVDPELIPTLKRLLDKYELQGSYFELELTERTLVQSIETMLNIMLQIKAMGIHFAIDDFGTGYSSLSYLKKMPMDCIKIDKSFLSGMLENAADFQIIASTIAMVQKLQLQVVAEGVETREQLELLRQQGCDIAQGYLIARPIPQPELAGFLEEHFPKGFWRGQNL